MQVPAFLSFWNLEHVLSVLLRLEGLDPIPNCHPLMWKTASCFLVTNFRGEFPIVHCRDTESTPLLESFLMLSIRYFKPATEGTTLASVTVVVFRR